MYESKYSKLLTILLIAGIILIVGILSVTGFMIIRNGKLKQEAEDAVEHFQGQVNGIVENTQEDEDKEEEKENVIVNEV